jgi:very-short-patch-repair endonuclease
MIPRHHNLMRARSLRRDPTEAERLLWKRLRHRQVGGAKFRRQHPIGNYIADFVCLEAMLIIEVDGSQHVDQAAYDAARTAYLIAEGFEVLRVWNNDLTCRPDSVMEAIYVALAHRLRLRQPPPSALRAPSPASGGR